MSIIDALILGVVQGITEFLPISSSGHLVIMENLMGLKVTELKSFDIVLHMGTLLAILIYFRGDFGVLARQLLKLMIGRTNFQNNESKLLLLLFVAMIPAVVLGLLFDDFIETYFRSPKIVAMLMFFVGIFFLIAEKYGVRHQHTEREVKNFRQALIIGISQSIALLPGISRSGSTIAAGVLIGIRREAVARFSFLLGAIAIAGAGILTTIKLNNNYEQLESLSIYFSGFLASALSGYLSVGFLMKFLKFHSLKVFAWYLMAISSILILWNF